MDKQFTLKQIVDCSQSINSQVDKREFDKDLIEVAKHCFDYVQKRSDHRTLPKTFEVLWQASYFDFYKSCSLQNNIVHVFVNS
jgi:hypothetical protein